MSSLPSDSRWHNQSSPTRLAATGRVQILGGYMLVSAVVEARAPAFITRTRDTVELPPRYRPLIAPVKALAGAGLLSARTCPTAARVSAVTLTLLFLLAMAAHIRVRDISGAMCAAALNAAVFATVAINGPADTRRSTSDDTEDADISDS